MTVYNYVIDKIPLESKGPWSVGISSGSPTMHFTFCKAYKSNIEIDLTPGPGMWFEMHLQHSSISLVPFYTSTKPERKRRQNPAISRALGASASTAAALSWRWPSPWWTSAGWRTSAPPEVKVLSPEETRNFVSSAFFTAWPSASLYFFLKNEG